MRTSGHGGSEKLMFIAPAAIFAALFFWIYGTPVSAIAALDRFIIDAFNWVMEIGGAVVNAMSR